MTNLNFLEIKVEDIEGNLHRMSEIPTPHSTPEILRCYNKAEQFFIDGIISEEVFRGFLETIQKYTGFTEKHIKDYRENLIME